MPMDFPNLKSLKIAAGIHKFRPMLDREAEESYREALAGHVAPIDFIESEEIRNKTGWDQWTDDQRKDMLRRSGMQNL